MPVHYNPMSLKYLTLKLVINHLEALCYGTRYAKGTKELAGYINTEGYKLIDGPFADWPSTLLEDLLASLYRHRCGQQHLLHCLIQPQMSKCTILQHGSIHAAMNLISDRCVQALKVLELNNSKNVPAGFYCGYFKKFTNLTKLSIYNSLVDDTGFHSIGETMHLLVELNASRTWITNYGIKGLCLNEELGRGEVSVYRCPRLVILNITGTRVTPEGVALFVACHPKAVRVEHEESFHGLALVHRQVIITKDDNYTCALSSLVTSAICMSPSEFEFAVNSCPLAEEIVILSSGLSDESLYRLMTLSRLTSLHLGNKNATCFNFYQGLAPVLDACGQTLKKLVLEDFTEVDVQMIGASCPRLEHLALSGTLTYAPIVKIQPGQFRNLKKLEIWNRDNRWGSPDSFQYSVCPLSIKQLLLYAQLDFLMLYKVDTVTDSLLNEIWQFNHWPKLRNVVLDHCQGITSATIWKLLEMPNELTVLRCWYCGGVPVETRDEIKSVIKEDNLLLYWEWYAYIENEDEIAAAIAAAELEEDEED